MPKWITFKIQATGTESQLHSYTMHLQLAMSELYQFKPTKGINKISGQRLHQINPLHIFLKDLSQIHKAIFELHGVQFSNSTGYISMKLVIISIYFHEYFVN